MDVMPLDVPHVKHLYIGLILDSNVRDTEPVCHSLIEGWIRHLGEAQDQRELRIYWHFSLYAPLHHPIIQRDVVGGIISQHRETLEILTYLTTVGDITFEMFGCLPSLKDLTVVCLQSTSTFHEVNHGGSVPSTGTPPPQLR